MFNVIYALAAKEVVAKDGKEAFDAEKSHFDCAMLHWFVLPGSLPDSHSRVLLMSTKGLNLTLMIPTGMFLNTINSKPLGVQWRN